MSYSVTLKHECAPLGLYPYPPSDTIYIVIVIDVIKRAAASCAHLLYPSLGVVCVCVCHSSSRDSSLQVSAIILVNNRFTPSRGT